MSCVYEHRCVVTGKRYIGKTNRSPSERWREHVTRAKASPYLFHKAIRKHGATAFVMTVHADGLTEDEAHALERKLISELGTKVPSGYNLTDGGEGVSGLLCSEHTRKKLRAALLGKPIAEETKAKISASLKGRKRTEEHQAKLAEARRGKAPTEETKQRLREAGKNREPISDETRAKLAEAGKRRTWSEETLAKISAALVGKKQDPDVTARVRAQNLGRVVPEEVRARVSAGLKAAWASNPRKAPSDEARARMSVAHKGHKHSNETRARMSAAHRARITQMNG